MGYQTDLDPVLTKFKKYVALGWPDKAKIPSELLPYFDKRFGISEEEGLLLWNSRIHIPETLKSTTLEFFHQGNSGIKACKALFKDYIWWPSIEIDIKRMLKYCQSCRANRIMIPDTLIIPWRPSIELGQRIHIDFSFMNKQAWFILTEAFTKSAVYRVKQADSFKTIQCLREANAGFGIPYKIVSDYASQFISEEVKVFCKHLGIKHIRSTTYHSRTNGLSEKVIRTLKQKFF
ncbi:Transposon Ty3-G Gag-Pol polyprotein [Thelohanellus kitauei]|uniref:Transposon Ty3-G Gag-Pol polyprotein n=1 Tax=Thelohanellus kitauei TaxID=669202 RepID=A0A0C2J5R1_THEKT|nr:Transposon Ty3-G Gag-Pol polyprotein [Thelohanellus kitauei]